MKKGLFYSPGHDFKELERLIDGLDLAVVPAVSALKRKVSERGVEFVYLVYQSLDELLEVFALVTQIAPQIPIVCSVTDVKVTLPAMAGIYSISGRPTSAQVLNAVAFHRARQRGEILQTYPAPAHDRFFLAETSHLGVVLANADDHIFYANDIAREQLSLRGGRRLMDQYCDLREHVVLRFEEEDAGNRPAAKVYDAVTVKTTGRVLSIIKRDVVAGNQRVGTVYHLEDSAERRANVQRLTDERRRFERLASRLNEVLLKDMSSHAYQLSYLKRKLDLEIRRSKRANSQVQVLSLSLNGFEKSKLNPGSRKHLLHEINERLLDECADPHVFGVIADGQWLIVWQREAGEIAQGGTWIVGSVTQCVRDIAPDAGIEAVLTETRDLQKYESGEELIGALIR